MYLLERNGPIVAKEMRAMAAAGRFSVVVCRYRMGAEGVAAHRTLKAAFRTLGSVCDSRGKRHARDAYAAAIVTPDGRVMNWRETRDAIRSA